MRTLSLILEGHFLKAALLRKDQKGVSIELVKTVPLSPDVKPLYILAPALETSAYTLVTGLQSTEVLFRKLTLPIADKKKALAALPFQLETLLPFQTEETIIAPLLKHAGKTALNATLFATRESHLQEHLETCATLDINPNHVSCTPIALFRLRQWLFAQEPQVAMIYWGEAKSLCVISTPQEILLSHTLHVGISDLIRALSRDFPEHSEEELKQLVLDDLPPSQLTHFAQIQLEITQELKRFDVFLKSKHGIDAETSWCLLGKDFPAHGLASLFSDTVSSCMLPLPVKESLSWEDLHSYALAIGLGLNGCAQDDYAFNLRQGKWAHPHQLRTRKRFLSLYCGACALLACVMGLFSHTMLHKKEKALAQELNLHIPPALANRTMDSEEELCEILWDWEKTLASQKLNFPFLPTVPKVSDVLAWLSTHPILSSIDDEKKGRIEIQSIRYQLVKYPKLGESYDPYIGRVDLEFTASSPRVAREFHDALLKGDLIVNAKKEIKWSLQNNAYFTSFELNPLNTKDY